MAVSRSMIASPTLECGKRRWDDSSSSFYDSRVAFEILGDDLVANVFLSQLRKPHCPHYVRVLKSVRVLRGNPAPGRMC